MKEKTYDIGIIGAMADEVNGIISLLEDREELAVSGIAFNTGTLFGKRVVIARCGIGKVFAAICTEAMIITFSPRLIVNTGVGGALDKRLSPCDIVFADKLCQHDMDTSAIGDPVGLVSGINHIYFECDNKALQILEKTAKEQGINYLVGTVATGDKFISSALDKKAITDSFSAVACEMEGGAVAHTAFVNNIPFIVVRAISDSADGDASMDYPTFLPLAVKTSTALTLALIKNY